MDSETADTIFATQSYRWQDSSPYHSATCEPTWFGLGNGSVLSERRA